MAERKKFPPIERLYPDRKSLDAAQTKARKELGYPGKRSRKFEVSANGKSLFVLASSPKDAVGRSRSKLGIKIEEFDPLKGQGGGIDTEAVLAEVAKTAKLSKEQLEAIRASLVKAQS